MELPNGRTRFIWKAAAKVWGGGKQPSRGSAAQGLEWPDLGPWQVC